MGTICGKLSAGDETAVAAVTDALRTYEKCPSASFGRDSCSAEFGDLDMAQDGIKTAIAVYEKVCR